VGHAGTKAPRLDTDKVHSIEREQTYYRVIGAIALAPFDILQRALEAALPSNGRLGMQQLVCEQQPAKKRMWQYVETRNRACP
jgi:hypothetical protein